jgi:hypothetical protein
LVLAHLQSFTSRSNRRRKMAVLPQALGQHRAQGRVGINHQNPLGLASGLIGGPRGRQWRVRGGNGDHNCVEFTLTAAARKSAYL